MIFNFTLGYPILTSIIPIFCLVAFIANVASLEVAFADTKSISGRNETPLKKSVSRCLVFSQDQLINQVPQFKKRNQVGLDSIVYSASFDLNDDKKPEYFYYLDEPGALSCGDISLQIGCPIKIYRQIGVMRFIDISADSMYPSLDFHPLKNSGYLCVSSDKYAGWYKLDESTKAVHKSGGEGTYQYNGNKYELIRKESK